MRIFRFSPLFPIPTIGIVGCALLLGGCGDSSNEETSSGGEPDPNSVAAAIAPYHDIPGASYIGAESCKTCHPNEFDDWLESDHHKAMLPANDETVLGDFADVTFEHFGRTWRFFRKGEEFWVDAEDADGERKDFKIDYAFGHYPLQQYLIPFPGGRYQALQVCWDSRPEEEGGQRWYHLYPEEEIPPDDILHWSRLHFNWNFMCADCHSTNLKKNFDPETDSYSTTWSSINVSCEACHGPASEHLKWATAEQAREAGGEVPAELGDLSAYLKNKGLVVTLKEPEEAGWAVNPDTQQPYRTAPLNSTVQVETCARCHSHRQLVEPHFTAGESFLDGFVPSALTDQLYHHDGQVDEEVYVYGSFVQSKMFHAGVRCTDCHDAHTSKLILPGNALCNRCHLPQNYDTPEHHHHPVGSTGASCVECHMPHKNYMVVDARRDHSIRIPRPDLTKKLGSPNACNQCHSDQTVDWAVDAFHEWWGKGPRNAHYGEILASARQGLPGSIERLTDLANDADRPGLVRATALNDLATLPIHREQIEATKARLDDPDPRVRIEAVALRERMPAEQRVSEITALLRDPVRSVRTEAARVLAPAAGMLSAENRTAFDAAADEFVTKQSAILDRAAGHLRLALFYNDLGRVSDAEKAYRAATKIEPYAVPPWVNLGELLYGQSRFDEAEAAFRSAVENADLDENRGLAHDALARFLIRQKRYDEGVEELKNAARLLPENAQVQYFLGVALNSTGRFEDALGFLKKAHEIDPNNSEYLVGLATICRDAGRFDEALVAAQKFAALNLGDPQAQALLEQIRQLAAEAESSR